VSAKNFFPEIVSVMHNSSLGTTKFSCHLQPCFSARSMALCRNKPVHRRAMASKHNPDDSLVAIEVSLSTRCLAVPAPPLPSPLRLWLLRPPRSCHTVLIPSSTTGMSGSTGSTAGDLCRPQWQSACAANTLGSLWSALDSRTHIAHGSC
jgi:hypothetical protein